MLAICLPLCYLYLQAHTPRRYKGDKKMYFTHEYDEKGNHRIVWVPVKGARRFGNWAGYQNYAHLIHAGKSAIAVSSYFDGGYLVPGKIYFLEAQ